jgi:hypothetical protein
VSYAYHRATNRKLQASKPKLHYMGTVRTASAAIDWDAIELGIPLVWETRPRSIELAKKFTLRGWRWVRTTNTPIKLEGWSVLVWRRAEASRRQLFPRNMYSVASEGCGCAAHHGLAEACGACVMLPLELPTAVNAVQAAVGVRTACSVRRMTRCHHVGAAAASVDVVYFAIPNVQLTWVEIVDRPASTPSATMAHTRVHPHVLPCIAGVAVKATFPYHRSIDTRTNQPPQPPRPSVAS